MSHIQFNLLHMETQNPRLDPSDFVDLMLKYAVLCQDQLQIYEQMELNRVGDENPMFWINKFQYARDMRHLEQAHAYLRTARSLRRINTVDMMVIERQESKFLNWLKKSVKQSGDRKDRRLFELIHSDQFIYRGISNVDIQSQKHQREDTVIGRLIIQYNRYCSEEKSIAVEEFQREQAKKPISWISQNLEFMQSMRNNEDKGVKYFAINSKNQVDDSIISSHLKKAPFVNDGNSTPKRNPPQYLRESSVKILRRTCLLKEGRDLEEEMTAEVEVNRCYSPLRGVETFRAPVNGNEFTFGKSVPTRFDSTPQFARRQPSDAEQIEAIQNSFDYSFDHRNFLKDKSPIMDPEEMDAELGGVNRVFFNQNNQLSFE